MTTRDSVPTDGKFPLTGSTAASFGPVREAFAGLLASGQETGAALVVVRDGDVVVDLCGGWRDAGRIAPWEPDTLVHPYSVSKPFAALVILTLCRDGLVDLDDRVGDHWAAYGAAGKQYTTVRQLLAHQAGVPAWRPGLPPAAVVDDQLLEAELAAAAPEWVPGTAVAEHAFTYGHLLSGLARAVTGVGFGPLFRERVAGPLGLDAWFGVPSSELSRVADLELAAPDFAAIVAGEPGSLRHRAFASPPGLRDPEMLNSTAWRQTAFPAIGMHTSARSLASFYAGLTALDGPVARLLGSELHEQLLTPVVSGQDLLLGREVTWTLGLQLDEYGFGMGGTGGCDAYADTRYGFGYCYLTRRLDTHDRSNAVLDVLESVLSP